ncbi:MAG: hypothetical protein WCS94_01190 [Verrucomicrobiota bacterium]
MQRQQKWSQGLAIASVLVSLLAGYQSLWAENAPAAKAVKLPFIVYDERGSANNHYIPSGWMGNAKATKMDDGCATHPHGGKTCLKVEYTATDNWSGIVWQDPANDWGDQTGGWNLTGAQKLKFWARGEQGDEVVSFKFGILGSDKKFSDSAKGEIADLKLTKDWTEYSIDLAGKDLTRIKTGFCWSVAGQSAPVVFYLDDIRFE